MCISSMQLKMMPGKSISSPPAVNVAKLGFPKAGRGPSGQISISIHKKLPQKGFQYRIAKSAQCLVAGLRAAMPIYRSISIQSKRSSGIYLLLRRGQIGGPHRAV